MSIALFATREISHINCKEIGALTNLEDLTFRTGLPSKFHVMDFSVRVAFKSLHSQYDPLQGDPGRIHIQLIPLKEIFQLVALKTLDLRHNNLKRIPLDIIHLKNLENLDLSHNGLEELPKEIGLLPSLKTLYLLNNKLRSIPKEIGL